MSNSTSDSEGLLEHLKLTSTKIHDLASVDVLEPRSKSKTISCDSHLLTHACSGRNITWQFLNEGTGSLPYPYNTCPDARQILKLHNCEVTKANDRKKQPATARCGRKKFKMFKDKEFARYQYRNWDGMGDPRSAPKPPPWMPSAPFTKIDMWPKAPCKKCKIKYKNPILVDGKKISGRGLLTSLDQAGEVVVGNVGLDQNALVTHHAEIGNTSHIAAGLGLVALVMFIIAAVIFLIRRKNRINKRKANETRSGLMNDNGEFGDLTVKEGFSDCETEEVVAFL